MTVPSETSSVEYDGDDVATEFPVTYAFMATSELRVIRTQHPSEAQAVWTEGVEYTATVLADHSGGTVTTADPLPAGDTLTIERVVPFTQGTAFRTQGSYSPSVHEDSFDESVFRDQQLDRRVKALESAGAAGSVVAGSGLFFSGATLHVGAGNGVVVGADDVAVDYGGAPADVTKAAASAGAATTVSRSDHKHNVSTAAPSLTAVVVGNGASEGTATSLARSDHVHKVAAGVPVPIAVATSAAGSAGSFADSAHVHGVSTAAPVELADSSNSEGAATSLARSNHVHSHGNRGGGSLHAVATSGAAGFMSAADKTKLDAIVTETVSVGGVKTTDATPTTVLTWTPTSDTTESVLLQVAGKRVGIASGAGYGVGFTVRRQDGTTALIGSATALWTHEDDPAWAVTVTVVSPAVVIQVTGAAATSIEWDAVARRCIGSA